MEPTKFTLPFRLVRDIWSPRGFDSDDSRLWLASFEGPAFINSFTVTFERTGYAAWVSLDPQLLSRFHVTTRTPANKWFFEDVSMLTFSRDQTDVHCIQVPVAGHNNPVLMLSAANLAGLAKRLHQFGRGKAFNQDWYGLTPTYDIHIKYSSTVGISFVNRMAIGQFNPSTFASSSDVRCLERLAGLEIWTDTKKADTVSTDIVPIFYEESTGAGGGFGNGALSVGYEAQKLNVGILTPVGLLLPDIGPSGPVKSAVLCTYHSPEDKYNAMAEMLCEMCELGTQVLIIGDQPCALVHALLASGRNVIGVSLENEEISTPTQESWGKYEQIRGKVFCDPDLRVASDDQGLVVKFVGNFAAYVVGTSSHTQSKIASTSKNIAIGQALKRNSPDVPVIVQLRDRPQKPLPTWELQYNLWALSMNGTNEERFSFMALKLRTAIFPRSTTGRVPGLPCENNGPLESFGVNLRDLGVKEQYDLADPAYARAYDEIFHLTRGPNVMKDEDMADTLRTPNRPLKASVSSSPTVYKISPESPRSLSESMHTNNYY